MSKEYLFLMYLIIFNILFIIIILIKLKKKIDVTVTYSGVFINNFYN